MRRWLVRIALLAAAVAVVVGLRLTVFAPSPIPVSVLTIGPGRVEETVTNSRAGTVRARRRARLSPEVGGKVVALPYREGDRVPAGAVVLRLDASVQEAQRDLGQRDLATAQARQEEACLAAALAERELARVRNLAQSEIVAGDALDQAATRADTARAGCTAAEAGVARARAAVALAETEVAKAVLRAPFAGVLAELSIEVGEWTTPSPPVMPVPPVIDLLDPTSNYISAPMDEVDSARIQAGQPVRVSVDSYPGRHFPARVVRVAPYVLDIEAQNRTVEIEVELEDAPFAATLLPGTSADVEVILEVREGVLRIPSSTLIEGDQVLVVADGHLAARRVEIGLKNWDYTEIVAGLEAGEQVVTSLDRPEVEAGAQVEVVEDGSKP